MAERVVIDLPTSEEVEVGGVVMVVGPVSAADAVDLMDATTGETRRDFNARLVAACVTRESGDRVGDVAYWSKQPARVVNSLARVALRVNYLNSEDAEGNPSAAGAG